MPAASEAALVLPVEGDPVLVSADKNRARAFAWALQGAIPVEKTGDLASSVERAAHDRLPIGGRILLAGGDDMSVVRAAQWHEALASFVVDHGQALFDGQRARRVGIPSDAHVAATRVADAMVAHVMASAAAPGMSGTELMAQAEYVGRRLGAERASCWLAVGASPAETYFETFELPDAVSRAARVQVGTTVLVDGYYSQVLRIGVFGEPPAELVDVADALIRMQDAALAAMVPGDPVTALSDVLETAIDEICPFPRAEDPFRFQSCHAMGNSYSEPWSAPFLHAERDRSNDADSPVFAAGQVYEVHPNFTMPGLGHVCAGDVALVTADGARWLSRTPRGVLRLD
jgi:Xaa-Pro aminopeptidase